MAASGWRRTGAANRAAARRAMAWRYPGCWPSARSPCCPSHWSGWHRPRMHPPPRHPGDPFYKGL
eukprot:scaffold1147_cov125-Isochrysis_galbana.AAC.10